MDIFNNCRICLCEISHEPIKMTRLILGFLEKSLQLTNVTKPNSNEDVKQNLCAPCFNKISEYQDFHEQCKDSDEFWKTQFDNLKQKTVEKQLGFEATVLFPEGMDDNSLEFDSTVPTIEENQQTSQNAQSLEEDDMTCPEEENRNILATSLPINRKKQVENFRSIDLSNWTDDINDEESDIQIEEEGEMVARVCNEELIEYEYQIKEEEVETEEIQIIDETECSESFGVDYRSFAYEKLEMEIPNESTILHQTIEDAMGQSKTTQNTFFMTTAIDENGKVKMSYKCQHCDKSFNRVYDIESHYNIHNGIKPYTCHVCGKSFRQKNILTTHQTLHFGKKVECAECGKKFARRSQLILHYRMHRDEKPFVCNYAGCEAAFRQRKQLIDHSFIHSGEKNFQCLTCTKSFHTRKRLQDHIYKVHSQHRYRCDLCDKMFLKPHMLKHHMITAHNTEVDDVSHLKTLVEDTKTTSIKISRHA